MNPLPITFCLFTSTKGHHTRKTDWRITVDHWNKQIPLSLLNPVAHVKVSPDETALGDDMTEELRTQGFHVIQTIGAWTRGLSHGYHYLQDQVKVSKDSVAMRRPYLLFCEDDSLAISLGCSLEDLLLRSCHLLETNHELVTTRLIRKGDYDGGVPQLADAEDGRAFYSPNTDFQPLLIRSLDFYRLGIILEGNPQACERVQCEALWAHILAGFSRNPHRHLVWRPTHAHTVHLGIPQAEHEVACQAAGLTPFPVT